ncbi:hypothetical protein L1987_05973 [Smallanthus sonchifolius]|uniref:Uncharacterized protein n=1 Tax=Smallanthus sonchifolius TaxID=185202 RepID=A0ACB9JX23_9ASTR|nr:hypothetical protein L1987_05973 [Smallanthus sonchifolius]
MKIDWSKSTVDNSRTRVSKLQSRDWHKLENMKVNKIMLKNEKQRKCVDVRKEKQSRKINAYSPRTLTRVECRIKSLEDMKRTRESLQRGFGHSSAQETRFTNDIYII